MLTRCDNCGGKFDKDEDWEMRHCGGAYQEHCDHCVEMLEEEREEREWRLWQEKVRQWDDEDNEDEVAE